jgi:hypothetical protein
MKRTWRIWLCFALIASPALFGQATEGTILGILHDPSGAVIHHGRVQVINVDTGVIRATDTNETGEYVVSNLPPGSYSVSVEVPGSRKQCSRPLR